MTVMGSLPVFDDVVAAAARIRGVVHRTPVLRSRLIDEQVGASLYFKAETFQRVGAFKFRGAVNALARLDAGQRQRGVVAFSSGNHAQAMALASKLAGIPAVIVMPSDAPAIKLAATRSYGAEVVTFDRFTESREAIGAALAQERGLTLIPPFDHPDIIAGQGTAALELFEDCGPLDALIAPVGGGGLLAGSALAAQGLSPQCRIIGAEPAAGDDARQSLAAGRIVRIEVPHTIADGAQTTAIGSLTFPILQAHVEAIVPIKDEALVAAMGLLAERMKILVEPTGCLGFATALRGGLGLEGKRVGIILSGGNIDLLRFAQLISDAKVA